MISPQLPEVVPPSAAGQSNPPPAAVAAGGRAGGFGRLSAEDRAQLMQVAMDFGISSREDPLFQIIAALQWHLRLYEQIPEQVAQAGATASDGIKREIDSAMQTLSAQMQQRAAKALLEAARGGEMQKVVRDVSAAVSKTLTVGRSRLLLGFGLVVSAIAVLAALVIGFYTGRVSAADPQGELAKFYMSQLSCSARGSDIECRLPADPRQGVLLRGPQ